MEIPRAIAAKAAITTSALAIAGCGTTIVENDKIASCDTPDGSLLEATTNPDAEDYRMATDPAILAAKMYNQAQGEAEKINEANSKKKWYEDQTYARLVVGMGEIACLGNNKTLYLTTEGTKLSFTLRDKSSR